MSNELAKEVRDTQLDDIVSTLQSSTLRYHELLNAVDNRLQLISRYSNENREVPAFVDSKEHPDLVSNLQSQLSKFVSLNDRLESCLEHLKRIA